MPPDRRASDLTDAQWELIEPSLPAPNTGGRDGRGYDAGKKVNGRKRFIITDTTGLLVTVAVPAASRQDRDGAKTALLSAYLTTPIRHVFADQGFAGRLVDWARDTLRTTLEIVRKPADQRGFSAVSRRWVVERTLAWLTACRRPWKSLWSRPARRARERCPRRSAPPLAGRRSRWLVHARDALATPLRQPWRQARSERRAGLGSGRSRKRNAQPIVPCRRPVARLILLPLS
ncbi:transposase [Nonomuraea spiralis]|uniref:Transposase n=1 Tax=Nonomuraea spiralis TaxID=46182 RepID=A0ABV5J258_9ACTN|nr:hypothetical protein GCM10010176_071000 [Nonomuraea spiralis]